MEIDEVEGRGLLISGVVGFISYDLMNILNAYITKLEQFPIRIFIGDMICTIESKNFFA